MVKFSSKLTYGPSICDWQERINVQRMREERAQKAKEIMKKQNIPALLAARAENTRYLTGLRGPEFTPQLWYVLFFAEGDPIVFAHAGWHPQLPEEAPWIKNWRLGRSWLGGTPGAEASKEESVKFALEIKYELTARGLENERLAIVGFDGKSNSALQEAGLTVEDGWTMMLEIRKTKTIDEINCIKMAEAITDVAWYATWESLRPGVNELDVSRKARDAAWAAGAEDVPPIALRSGPISFDRGLDRPGRIIQYGDLVYGAYCGISYLGYRSCYYRTFIVGREPNEKERGWYKNLVERLDAVIGEIKPGKTTADAAKHFPPASKWGYKDECEVLTMEIGHGIGINQYEYPIINRQWSLDHPQIFEPGMVIAIEGREGERGHGGVRLEDVIVVTDTGAELVDHFPRDEITVAGK